VNLTLKREALLTACRLAARLLPEHPISPAEQHFLLRAGATTSSLRSAGPQASLSQPLVAQVEQPGEVLLPARAAVAILRATTADEVTLEGSGAAVVLHWPGARYRLESPATSLFPPDEPVPGGPGWHVGAGDLCRAIGATLFAAGPGSRRYQLDGVLFEVEPGRLRVVATDNRRLAVAEMPARPDREGLEQSARVLPAVAVALLARLADTGKDGVQMRFGPERAFFTLGEVKLSCRYEPGPYAPWRSAVPASPPCRLEVPVAGFLAAVRQAAVLREREGARLLLSLETGRLVLESGRAGAGSSRVARKVPYQGRPVQLALEPRFLVELLRCLEGQPTVQVGLTNADTPALFQAGDYTHVLMPLRLE
jgi:DNA polymerase-3 subunit beta